MARNETFDQRMERACKDLEIPGAVLAGGDRSGRLRYEKAFGQRSLKDPSKHDPMKLDSTMWLASCTKLLTTICVMQCVEQGLLKLDDNVYSLLPELKDLPILIDFTKETREPILKENTKSITLRHMLTHSSGLSYDIFNPLLMRYRKWEKKHTPSLNIKKTVSQAHLFPLLFSPGEGWEYSVGIDWAGLLIERLTHTTLESYMHKNIFSRLSVSNFTFHPKTSPTAVLSKLVDMSFRDAPVDPVFMITKNPEAKVVYTDTQYWNMDTPDCQGGAGGYLSPVDYQKVLHSLCSDNVLLNNSAINEMFTPQLTPASRAMLMAKLAIPESSQALSALPAGANCDWGLGGMMNLDDLDGRRRKGSLCWGGHPNLIWFCDRNRGISGIFGTQIEPCGDPKANKLFALWERELYRMSEREKL